MAILDSEDSANELFQWLKSTDFIEERNRGGWYYRDIIRIPISYKQRSESPNRWISLHNKLSSYYKNQWLTINDNLRFDIQQQLHNSGWQTCFLNWLYHYLCVNPIKGLTEAINIFLNALDESPSSEFLSKCAEIIVASGEASEDQEVKKLGDNLSRGIIAFNSNKYDEGIEMLTFLLTKYNLDEKSKSIALKWRGDAFRLTGKYNKSLQDFNIVISINENDFWTIISRSSTHRKMRNYDDSLNDCNTVIKLNSKDIRAFTSRGETYLRMRKYDQAIQDFSTAIALDPEDTWSIASRGKAYEKMRLYSLALKDYNLVLQLNPNDAWTLSNRGFINRKIGNYVEALRDYDIAIQIDFTNSRLFASRAETYRLIGDYNLALQDFTIALDWRPEDAWTLCRRAETYLLLDKYNDSFADFEKVISLTPNNDWRLFTYSLALKKAGHVIKSSEKLASAIKVAETRYSKSPEDYRTALTLALYYVADDKDIESKELYEKIISRSVQQELLDEAIKSLEDLLKIFPNHKLSSHIKSWLSEEIKQI
jgi:tetratricopeptide (TPR) repeat protein